MFEDIIELTIVSWPRANIVIATIKLETIKTKQGIIKYLTHIVYKYTHQFYINFLLFNHPPNVVVETPLNGGLAGHISRMDCLLCIS